MLREVFRSRMFFVSMLLFVLIVVGSVFYLKHAEREAGEDLAGTQERMKPLAEAQKLTYHVEFLETHPVEALRQQARELEHWSAEHIPPFPPEDPEAADFARNLYIMRYYKHTGQMDDPVYLAADQAQGEFRHALNDRVVETPWEHARKLDLKKLTWPDTIGLSGLATTPWVTTFTEGINPESARPLRPIELENSNRGRHDSLQYPAKMDTLQDDTLPAAVSNAIGTQQLTYHAELLEIHPVEALRQQAWELGHWSAEHIPPFPPEDREAADFARNTYLFLYYMRTGQIDHPAYLAASKAQRKIFHSLRRAYDSGFKTPWEVARNHDLMKLTWPDIPPLDLSIPLPTTFTEGINPQSARPLLPFELDESLWRRTSD